MPVGGLVPKVAQAQTAGRGQEMRQDKTDGKNRKEETQRGRLDIIFVGFALFQILMLVDQTKSLRSSTSL